VPDVVATAEFYRDKLGFELLGYFLDPPVYAMVRRDSKTYLRLYGDHRKRL
jgi:catechol 2,3-dioxygenase-like lactoylglutathione lyase family enzyme